METDLRNEKISYKVREHSVSKVPFILAVGGREEEAGTVAGAASNNDQQVIDMSEALDQLRGESLPPDMARGVDIAAEQIATISQETSQIEPFLLVKCSLWRCPSMRVRPPMASRAHNRHRRS